MLEGQQSQAHGGTRDHDMQDAMTTTEAVGPGAADELTGPLEPRREQ